MEGPNHLPTVSDSLLVERTSTADQVAGLLRHRILSGELKPGTPLREVHLAELMGVSRNTVREGIRALVSESLVRHNVHKGVVVASLTERDVADLYAARRILETSAVNATVSISREQLRALELQADQVDVAIKDEDFGAILNADFAFHVGIVSLHGVDRLTTFLTSILAELRLGLFLLDKGAKYTPEEWSVDHREVYDLLASGKRQQCVRVLNRHLTAAEFELIGVVRDRALGNSG